MQKDFEGYDLYYKITANDGSALTFTPESNSVSLADYSGNIYQKYKLNLDGLEGFAANCKVNGKEKAGTVGGLLGETVFADSVDKLIAALDSTDPKTVVITKDIDLVNQNKTKQRIRDNKTIIGSYSKNTIYDSQLRNDDFYGQDATPSGNIVIRNVNWVGRTLNDSGSGTILLQFYGVRNLWLDHNSFSATFSQNRDKEVGKFVWINTPANNWSDAKYNGYNPDYITASYNYFKNRYWTFAFGSQNKETSRLHTTLMFNKWEQCSRRCPQYSNGFDHNYNNYHTVTGSSNPNKSSQVIGGEGSRVVNQNCRFEGYKGNELDPDRNSAISFTESGSYTADSPSGTPSAISFKNHGTAWNPNECYGYHLVAAYNTNGTEIKAFCNAYSGCFKSYAQIKYITDADCADFISQTVDNPFLKEITVGNEPVSGGKAGAQMDTAHTYAITNLNSGLYLGETQTTAQTLYTLEAADANYYLIQDAATGKYLTVENGDTGNGTALILSAKTSNDAQLFRFVPNDDGSYTITTKVSRGSSCLGVAMGSKNAGAAVVEWTSDGSANQCWNVQIYIAPLNGKTISVQLLDSDNYANWHLTDSVNIGTDVYGDRDEVTYTAQPDSLIGAEYLQPACDSKNSTGDLAKVTAITDVTLYAAFDTRVTTVPAWISDWTKTTLTSESSKGVTYAIYSKKLSAGETVTLGENGQSSGCVQYTLFAVKSGNVKGNVNGDGACNLADLVSVQKYLLTTGTLTNWKAADLDGNGRINAADFTLMKRMLLK